MATVWIARTSQWVEKLFNVKGSPVLSDIEPTLRVVLPWFTGNEDRAPALWNRYCTYTLSPAVAAQFSAIRFRNPAGSNVVGVFEKVTAISQGTVDQPNVRLQAGSSDFASAVVSQRADPRGQLLPTLIATQGSNASLQGGNFLIGQVIATGGVYDFVQTLDQEVVVLPGDSLTLWSNNLNLALEGSFTWRERALQQSELT